ncbi:DUF4396 domain-containing protein [Rhodobacteraceae bacterium RKSG542]|uniref:DUF4396 domain-containing protein n=1 Tax=Pseudovibrio flavus TaxID=2529854 RepID=UPI0012BBC618|nr:DUF4396 domain-containing protein [Pseudovibrio flavus]MTI17125.1 DUF4396 domain-containing protein [Pseudovibrio flavus]
MLDSLAVLTILLGVASSLYILIDQRDRPPPMMAIMKWVWPINALWAGPLVIWAYKTLGTGGMPKIDRHAPHQDHSSMQGMDMSSMDMDDDCKMSGMEGMKPGQSMDDMEGMGDMKGMSGMKGMEGMHMSGHKRPFWQSIVAGTMHCGAGCSLADMIGPWLFFLFIPFTFLGSYVFGEWVLDYVLALAIGVWFQRGGLLGMVPETGVALLWRALKIDFFSLTAWQVGMYGWMAIAIFGLVGPMTPLEPRFWLMMQIAMFCGFLTAYPMNWFLVKKGVKKAM